MNLMNYLNALMSTNTTNGVVAQLGEHLHGMQGVGGSNPPNSTNLRKNGAILTYASLVDAPL